MAENKKPTQKKITQKPYAVDLELLRKNHVTKRSHKNTTRGDT